MLPNPRAHPDHPGDRAFIDHLMRDEYGYEQCPHCEQWGHHEELGQHIGREHPAERGEGDEPG